MTSLAGPHGLQSGLTAGFVFFCQVDEKTQRILDHLRSLTTASEKQGGVSVGDFQRSHLEILQADGYDRKLKCFSTCLTIRLQVSCTVINRQMKLLRYFLYQFGVA